MNIYHIKIRRNWFLWLMCNYSSHFCGHFGNCILDEIYDETRNYVYETLCPQPFACQEGFIRFQYLNLQRHYLKKLNNFFKIFTR